MNNACSIGSGTVESAVKQIDRRLKISGPQWKPKNVNQILQLRCAYLNWFTGYLIFSPKWDAPNTICQDI